MFLCDWPASVTNLWLHRHELLIAISLTSSIDKMFDKVKFC
jgi:hypothetical protein